MLLSEYKVDTMDYAVSAIDEIANIFEFKIEKDTKRIKNENSQLLYKLYDKYSFTPTDVMEKVNSQDSVINGFVNQIFSNLSLDLRNKERLS